MQNSNTYFLKKISKLLRTAPRKKTNQDWLNEAEALVNSYSIELYNSLRLEGYYDIQTTEKVVRDYFMTGSSMVQFSPYGTLKEAPIEERKTFIKTENINVFG